MPGSHDLRVFVGPIASLQAYTRLVPAIRIYALRPRADFHVIPLDDDIIDALHAAYGTGDWLDSGPQLSSGDMVFAAKASRAGPLAYLERYEDNSVVIECAAVWDGGMQLMRPHCHEHQANSPRPPTIRPINAALKRLGVAASDGLEPAATIGLTAFKSSAAICERASQMHL